MLSLTKNKKTIMNNKIKKHPPIISLKSLLDSGNVELDDLNTRKRFLSRKFIFSILWASFFLWTSSIVIDCMISRYRADNEKVIVASTWVKNTIFISTMYNTVESSAEYQDNFSYLIDKIQQWVEKRFWVFLHVEKIETEEELI